jgi:LmbE family N-acetylglucosaminyl deacetylase
MKKINILAIGPHPDDIEYGCGGTLAISKLKKYGIHLLVMSKGEAGGDSLKREKEMARSAKLLKADLHWGGFLDTQVTLNANLIGAIEGIIKEVKPDVVLTPYYNDTHQDHRTISTATITATRHYRNVLFYEVPSSVDFVPNTFVDIGKVIKTKLELLRIHHSQVNKTKVPGLNILENARSTAIFRGVQDRVKYAEGFLPLRLSLQKFEL